MDVSQLLKFSFQKTKQNKVRYIPEVNFCLHIDNQPDNSKMLDSLSFSNNCYCLN